ncbi:MAG: hypothetical protein IJQ26_02775, partial [Lachnospiraceae bacterium]|nr:hypothetical protein [Lachnospiraceae bacterium]
MLNYKYKDRLFTNLFGREEHKEWILSLYNAVNGTSYTDKDAIEINTMEDVVYMGMKNDVSFLLGHEISIYEHQSTCNPNMPLRMLVYLGRLYDKYTKQNRLNIYGETQIHIPLPQLIVFYNGLQDMPDERELYLRDAFSEGMDKDKADVAVRVRMLNIN